MDKLINILKSSNVADYQIVQKETISHQAFFVEQKLDQHRINSVTHTTLTIYVDNEDKTKRGSSTKEIYQDETEDDIRQDIENMKFNALLAMNPYYPLVENQKHFEEKSKIDLLDSLKNVVKAIQSIKNTETEKINSYEIFVNQNYIHILNSQNVNITYNQADEMVEIVINSLNKEHEVEVYHMIETGADQTTEEIRNDILEVFKKANDRSKAIPAKKAEKVHVLLSGSDLKDFFNYFVDKINTQLIYGGNSCAKLHDQIQQGDDTDKISLKAVAKLPYSSLNVPYSREGTEASDYMILDNGKYVNYTGSQIYAHYLGLKNIPFAANYQVSGGSKTIEQMKKQPYLEIVQFSSFQVDIITGDFGGEFRLAYYYDGETVKPVTAGSITVNMNDILNHMYLSKETKQYNNWIIPQTIELFDVDVAGE